MKPSAKLKLGPLVAFFKKARPLFSRENWRKFFERPSEGITLVLLSKRHFEVRKFAVSAKNLWALKWLTFIGAVVFFFSFIFFIDYSLNFSEQNVLRNENFALRTELNHLQANLDRLQISVDRISRFDQKLRALTEVDKEFAKMKGPGGQGGSEPPEGGEQEVYDFGDYKVDGASLELQPDSTQLLDRREAFLIQKIYSWMHRLFRDSELEEQSYEELFEVLKGRELQLEATPSILPVKGWITSHFGYRLDPFSGKRALHRGLDVAAREGAPVMAPADGVVTYAGGYGSFGNVVMLFHGYGISTLFAHCESVAVHIGQKVHRGEVISYVGSTGRSTGAHVHYEVIVHGVPVDPQKYLLDRSL